MRSLAPFTLLIALVLTSAVAFHAQQSVGKGGSFSGRVILANKGVAGVTVTITMSGDALSGSGLKLKAITDDEGRFRISNLPPGSYYVWPFIPAFVVAEATGLHPQGKSVSVVEGEAADGVDFNLTRGAVITGKVTDSTGRAVIDERVRILPVDQNLRRLISSVYPNINDIRTDDRGIYRAFGLPAGQYKVAVGDPQFGAFTSTRGRRFYLQTFHPDVSDEAKAQLVEIAEGGEVSGVDISVARAMSGFSASGRFIEAKTGQPLPNINFGLTVQSDRTTSRGWISLRAVSTTNGLFQIDNLPPGKYAVSVLPASSAGYYGASDSFDINDGDVTDLEVKVHRGSTISGNAVVEGTANRTVLARLTRARLEAITWGEGNSVGTVRHTNINADGSFQIGPVQAGNVSIRLGSVDRNVAPEFVLLGIDVNGVDKSQSIQVTEGEDIFGVKLVVGYGTGTIRGTVVVEGVTLPEGTYVEAGFHRPGSSLTIGHTLVDARGRFLFERVPPGNYELAVNARLPTGRVSARQSVVTSNGVVTEVTFTLKLNTAPTTGP